MSAEQLNKPQLRSNIRQMRGKETRWVTVVTNAGDRGVHRIYPRMLNQMLFFTLASES